MDGAVEDKSGKVVLSEGAAGGASGEANNSRAKIKLFNMNVLSGGVKGPDGLPITSADLAESYEQFI